MVQLQAVKDRVPARGSAIGTICALLDSCMPISNPQALLPVSTLPVPPPPVPSTNYEIKSECTLNGPQISTDLSIVPPPLSSQAIQATDINVEKHCVDTGTNTTQTTSNRQMPSNQTNGKIAPVINSVNQVTHQSAINSDANDELDFRNLKLKCMCSDDMEMAFEHQQQQQSLGIDNVDVASHKTSTTSQTMTSATDDSQRCSHCGRGHCCFFLRCCHCLSNDVLYLARNDLAVDVSATGPLDQHPVLCGNNNVNNNKLVVDRNVTVRSATARCDEVCKIQSCVDNEQIKQSGLLCPPPMAEKRCCVPVESEVEACHCQWYCLQECVSDSNLSKQSSESNEHTHNLQVTPVQIDDKRTIVAATDDENQLRCCRCSREIF